MLNIAVVGVIPPRRSGPAIGIERDVTLGTDRFDPHEYAERMVITVPLDITRSDRPVPMLN